MPFRRAACSEQEPTREEREKREKGAYNSFREGKKGKMTVHPSLRPYRVGEREEKRNS